jgi:signal transduction histidine kinase/HAMP domain-containing protein/CheY-like chemotaxis protein
VAREVGTEGRLGGQAYVSGVAGTWKDLTDSVNMMAGNLTGQVRNIAEVATAIANGDLSKKITVDVRGEILELKDTINVMVDQLRSFASEVTRVAREVGTEGRLGGQAQVSDVAGTWKDLTDSVNMMAGNLTGQVRNIAEVATAIANGDLSKKITVDVRGEILELKDTINVMVDQLNSFASEVTRVAREVGTEGRLGGQAYVSGVAGTWKDLTDNVNMMASNLTGQVRNIAAVTTAVANGDLSKKITVDVKGEILELKDTVNVMVDQLNSFASEVTRVAREVGTEGRLGGQAQVRGVSGTWKDLTDSVNMMAANLTGQVRGIAKVVTGVANGDLKQKLTVDAKGEIASLADTINSMIDTLATFADQVTSVAREVGVEGQLGGQASVPGAAGIWKDLTDNVNQLAENLTTQMRAIAEVATAVTKGDLTRSIRVEASGEVAVLKDNINEMIRNLRDTTQKNSEQDWLKTNLAKFTRMLPGQKELFSVARLILSELAPLVSAQHGIFYLMSNGQAEPRLRLLATYAYKERKGLSSTFALGEGLVGQCALEKERILITDVPSDYVQINSGLGHAVPLSIIVLPVLFEGEVKAVIELASFQRFSDTHLAFLEQLTESIGIVLNTIEANVRTEELLKQSQSLAGELQSRQEELQQTNLELQEKARLLAEQNAEVERKNSEVEQAKFALEEKASQLALTSRYKSEFLANMSHELRTPLNSLLLLARQLADNPNGNLLPKQVEFADAIHDSGSDLLMLINDILDLSKIESGTAALDVGAVSLRDLCNDLERMFRPIADTKGLALNIALDAHLPPYLHTDKTRLQQVLKNLLSNALKFTARGQVTLQVSLATAGWSPDLDTLNNAEMVVAFAVSDTGIGIAADKQRLIFEAFQQADGTTSRKYGGTGLGLSISREIARLFGGEIRLQSAVGTGSTFTFYLPQPALVTPSWPQWMNVSPEGANGGGRTERPAAQLSIPPPRLGSQISSLSDDREHIQPGDRVVLIVENDINFARVLLDIVHETGMKGVIALHGATACALARQYKPDAITLDLLLPDVEGWTVLELLQQDPDTRHIPVHIITVVDAERERGVQRGVASYLIKPVSKQAVLEALITPAPQPALAVRSPSLLIASRPLAEPVLAGKKVLIVDDDVRNLFALTSILEEQNMEILAAESGKESIDLLQNTTDVDVILMDIMMPEMDGYDTMRSIRQVQKLRHLPIIAITAKAMPGDREKCLEAGASDYLAKPVNVEQLLTHLRSAIGRQ